MSNIKEKLAVIQQEMNVPKSKPNRFGGYKYRNVDMIVAAVKPLLKEQKCILTLNDEVVEVGGRVYVKATAVIEETDGDDGGVGVNGWAREQLERKKSDDSQLTGAASTYARKRALEGLFLLDDSGDVTDPDEYEDDPDEELDEQEAEEQEEKPIGRKPRSRRQKKEEEITDDDIPFNKPEEEAPAEEKAETVTRRTRKKR